jgi:hypothetical protein
MAAIRRLVWRSSRSFPACLERWIIRAWSGSEEGGARRQAPVPGEERLGAQQAWFEDNFEVRIFTRPAFSSGTKDWNPIHDIEPTVPGVWLLIHSPTVTHGMWTSTPQKNAFSWPPEPSANW